MAAMCLFSDKRVPLPLGQGGYDRITVSEGQANVDMINDIGFLYSQLQYQTLAYSLELSNAGCAFYAFASNYSTVDAYLTTSQGLEAMLNPQVS